MSVETRISVFYPPSSGDEGFSDSQSPAGEADENDLALQDAWRLERLWVRQRWDP